MGAIDVGAGGVAARLVGREGGFVDFEGAPTAGAFGAELAAFALLVSFVSVDFSAVSFPAGFSVSFSTFFAVGFTGAFNGASDVAALIAVARLCGLGAASFCIEKLDTTGEDAMTGEAAAEFCAVGLPAD